MTFYMRFLVHITLFQVRMPRKVQWSQRWRNSRNCVSKDVSLNDKNNTSKTMADIDFQLSDREGVFSWPCGLQCVLNCTLDEICFFRLASPRLPLSTFRLNQRPGEINTAFVSPSLRTANVGNTSAVRRRLTQSSFELLRYEKSSILTLFSNGNRLPLDSC